MIELINKIQASMQIAEDPILYDLLKSIRDGMTNKLLDLQADRRKLLKALKEITSNRLPEWLRGRLETMISELEKVSV